MSSINSVLGLFAEPPLVLARGVLGELRLEGQMKRNLFVLVVFVFASA